MRRYCRFKKLNVIMLTILIVCSFAVLNSAQDQSVLAQKLMLENTIRMRVTDALETLLEDARFVVDVKVDLEFQPLQKQETVYKPSHEAAPVNLPPEKKQETIGAPTPETKPEEKSVSLPGFEMLPGIPTYSTSPEKETKVESTSKTTQEQISKPSMPEETMPEVISHSVEQSTISIPKIKRMEINLILEEGIAAAAIENIRRVVEVAAQFDRNRGDVINIMSSSFSKKENQKNLDAIFLKNIAEKLDKIEQRQEEQEKQKALQEKLSTERAAAKRDSQRIAMLTDEISKLKMQIMAGDLNQEEKQQKESQAQQREQELQMVKAQLEESNRRLAELEKGLVEEGRRQAGVYPDNRLPYLIAGAVVIAILLLFLIIWLSQKSRSQRKEMPWTQGFQQPLPQQPVQATPSVQPAPQPAEPGESPPSTKKKISKPAAPAVNQQEVKGLRQSVITLSVGQPDTASRIVKDWLSEQSTGSEEEEEGV